jgi:ribosomal-protein-alanine N-acetyltransferase
MGDVTLREYRAGDWVRMHELDIVCFEPVFRFSRGAMRRFAEANGAVTVLAEADGELAGFCIVQMEGQLGYVVTLDVAAAWRRNGLARRLMEDAETKVRAAGAEEMTLHVYTENRAAIRFYEAMGYERVGLAKWFYGTGLDAWLYEKRLEDRGRHGEG